MLHNIESHLLGLGPSLDFLYNNHNISEIDSILFSRWRVSTNLYCVDSRQTSCVSPEYETSSIYTYKEVCWWTMSVDVSDVSRGVRL
jgi:hypothetical protein